MNKLKKELMKDPKFRKEYNTLHLGDMFIDYRLDRELTQRDLARKMRLPVAIIRKIESEKYNPLKE